MTIAPSTTIRSVGYDLDMSPESFGELRDSSHLRDDHEVLRQRMADDGYLLMRGFFAEDLILNARRGILEKMRDAGVLNDDAPLMEGRYKAGVGSSFSPEYTENNEPMENVVFSPQLMKFYEDLLDGTPTHYSYKWLRTSLPGNGTHPHCDIVYMGRGTWDVYTAWVPYGHIDLDLGGLMVLEGSHKQKERLQKYWEFDVDTYCENIPGHNGWKSGGKLTTNPVSLRERLGGRWLTAEFFPGDFITFGMGMVHGSLDNQTEDRIRISSDTRYQLASEPIDERWGGENPTGHGDAAKRGKIC